MEAPNNANLVMQSNQEICRLWSAQKANQTGNFRHSYERETNDLCASKGCHHCTCHFRLKQISLDSRVYVCC